MWILKFTKTKIKQTENSTERFLTFTEVFKKKNHYQTRCALLFYPNKQKQIITDNFGYERPKITLRPK